MSIYENLLGKDFQRLHPKLQARYAFSMGKTFYATGTMSKIETGAIWIKPFLQLATHWKFLFPENGKDVPFTIQNTCRISPTGQEEIYWVRTFQFEKVTRFFIACMTMDTKRSVVKDYLGEPSLFYSDLTFTVTPEGRMQIRSGSQRVVIGKLGFPIHPLFQGVVTVEEGYDDMREVFTIQVDIRNRLIGKIMVYDGEFKVQSHF
ncbi:DUF4166 domain-containing protein [Shimazuella kribbensis]|uniref:DUF4166 domain-containing protein n=1 Tax=Shimazuella kribbensis TaxID=139808 RepID=UPI0004172FE0|nr:DUF4166 domain-containing protein [Shimazuella kribbensis]